MSDPDDEPTRRTLTPEELKAMQDSLPDSDSWPDVTPIVHWENPEIIQPLLTSDEPSERELVQTVIKIHHELTGKLEIVRRSRDVGSAAQVFRAARVLRATYLTVVKTLTPYHVALAKTMSAPTMEPRVGLGAKLEAMAEKFANSPTAELIDRLEWVEECYQRLEKLLGRNEASTRYLSRHKAHCDFYRAMGYVVPTEKAAIAWGVLRGKADVEQTVMTAAILKFRSALWKVRSVRAGSPDKRCADQGMLQS